MSYFFGMGPSVAGTIYKSRCMILPPFLWINGGHHLLLARPLQLRMDRFCISSIYRRKSLNLRW